MARNEHVHPIVADIVHAASAQVPEPTKHTPGPWEPVRDTDPSYRGWAIMVGNYPRIAYVHPIEGCNGESEANARLIAAAPEMAEYIASSASAGCATAKLLMAKMEARS